MSTTIDCAGAPRDLGLDQGRACAETLRRLFGRLPMKRRLALRAGLTGPAARGLLRQLGRHFPHQAETLDGLAVGAGVPLAWLAEETRRELAREEATRSVVLARGGPGAVARGLEGPWVVRRSRPEGLFASLELTRPWLGFALLGVNERGLAASVVAGDRSDGLAPGALLAQDCLERFEALEAALEWCEGRPGGGRAIVMLADAGGDAAGIEIDGAKRRVLRPSPQGLVLAGGNPDEAADLAKRLAEAPAEALAAGLSADGVAALVDARQLVAGGQTFSL